MTKQKDPDNIRFRTIVKYNSLFWGPWIFFYAIIFYINVQLGYSISLASSFTLTLPLFLLSLLLWPLFRKLQYVKIHISIKVIIHLVGANIYSVLWLSFYYGVLIFLFGNRLFTMFDVEQTIVWQYPVGITYYLMISGTYYSLIYYKETKNREIKESQLQMILKEMQLNALKNQLNPHFLFNALNSINALITSEPQKARKMLIKVSDLLRLSISKQKQSMVNVATEMKFVHTYLEIEKIRLAERLEYTEKIYPSLMDAQLPSMILQPLIENAIKHGIATSRKEGFIELTIKQEDSRLKIEIRNSLAKTEHALDENSNAGLGLKNIEKRLINIYGANMEFKCLKMDDEYLVIIILPFTISV